MKKIVYTVGPDRISVGTGVNETQMMRGVPVEVSDELAAAMLTNPMFCEAKEEKQAKEKAAK